MHIEPMAMTFQIGKYYQHTGGRVLSIIGTAHTFFHGSCLLGEEKNGSLVPVGKDDDATVGWHEVSGWPQDVYDENNIPPAAQRHQGATNEEFNAKTEWFNAKTK